MWRSVESVYLRENFPQSHLVRSTFELNVSQWRDLDASSRREARPVEWKKFAFVPRFSCPETQRALAVHSLPPHPGNDKNRERISVSLCSGRSRKSSFVSAFPATFFLFNEHCDKSGDEERAGGSFKCISTCVCMNAAEKHLLETLCAELKRKENCCVNGSRNYATFGWLIEDLISIQLFKVWNKILCSAIQISFYSIHPKSNSHINASSKHNIHDHDC